MKKLLLALLLIPTLALARGKEFYLPVRDFHCGLDSYHSSLNLDDCYVQSALNVYFDKEAGATKRKGYTVFGTSATYKFSGAWTYTDATNNAWLVVRGSSTIMASAGNGTFSVKIATVTATDTVSAVNAFGSIYFVDQTQGVYFWNGTSTTFVTGSPKGSFITEFHGRVWVAGQAVPNGNLLNGSKYLDGSTWATGALATDPVQLTIGLNDNYDNLTGEFSGFNDLLYLFKNNSIYGMTGFDQTDFTVRIITREVGCIDAGSIQPLFGGLFFMSRRGLEAFDGVTPMRISNPIKNLIDPATTNSYNQRSWTQSTAADWTSDALALNGPGVSLSTSVAAPALVLNTFTGLDSTTANFNLYTSSSGIDTASNQVTLKTFLFDDFSSFSNWTNESTSYTDGNMGITANVAQCASGANSCQAYSNQTIKGDFLIQADVTIGSNANDIVSVGALNGSAQGYYFDALNNTVLLRVTSAFGLSATTVCSGTGGNGTYTLIRRTSDNTVWLFKNGAAVCHGTDASYTSFTTVKIRILGTAGEATKGTINDVYDAASFGQITSRVLDSSFSTTQWGLLTVAETANNGNFTYATKTAAASGGAYTSGGAALNGQNIIQSGVGPPALRYIIYTASISALSNTGAACSVAPALPKFTSVTIGARASSGSFTSVSQSITGANTFGTLTVSQDLSTGGTTAYSVCTSANSNMIPRTCVVTTANSQITVATNTFVQVTSTFTITDPAQNPTLNSFTITWNEGTKRPRMTSAVYDNRYWLALTTSTADSTNEATIVMAKGPVFSLFDLHAGAFLIYKDNLYHADADATGNVYSDDTGYADNGVAINAYVKTKDYIFPTGEGDAMMTDKYFDSFYLEAENLGNYNLYTNYYVDGVSTGFALGTPTQNELTGRLTAKLPFPIDAPHQVFGRTIAFQFQQNDLNAPMKLLGGILVFKERPVQ